MISKFCSILFLAILGLIFGSTNVVFSQGNESSIVIEGHYQGKNLYVQNPFSGSGVGFCVIAVYVNDDVTTDQVNSSAFEIDFSNTPIQQGDAIVVRIQHKLDCLPKVLNPEVLRPKSTFESLAISIDKNQILNWKTTKEQGKLTYVVEQYRWNKWVKIGEVDGAGKCKKIITNLVLHLISIQVQISLEQNKLITLEDLGQLSQLFMKILLKTL